MVYTNINNNGQNDVLVNNTFSESYHTVRTVYNNLISIETVKDNITEMNNILANITSINNVGNSITNINTVGSNIDTVNTVKNNITNVNTVSANVSNVNNVSNNINDILTVKNNLPNINTTATNINTVNNIGNNIDNVNLISNNIDAITTVKNNLTNIDTIFDNISSVSNVGSNINNVNAVGSNIGTINLVNSNLSVIQGAADVINELNGRYINNITALRATEPAYSKQFVYLVGHTVTNVGGGLFYYDDTDTTSLDDNGIIIVTNGGKRWKRILDDNGVISVDQFGDTSNSTVDHSVIVQTAIDYAAIADKAISFTSGRIYNLSGVRLTNKANAWYVYGNGCTIQNLATSTSNTPCLYSTCLQAPGGNARVHSYGRGVFIYNITFRGKNGFGVGYKHIVDGYINILDCRFSNLERCVITSGVAGGRFNGCSFSLPQNGIGVFMAKISEDPYSINYTAETWGWNDCFIFDRCTTSGGDYGYYYSGSGSEGVLTIRNNINIQHKKAAVFARVYHSFIYESNWTEFYNSAECNIIHLSKDTNGFEALGMAHIRNNHFYNGSGAINYVIFNENRRCIIENNHFQLQGTPYIGLIWSNAGSSENFTNDLTLTPSSTSKYTSQGKISFLNTDLVNNTRDIYYMVDGGKKSILVPTAQNVPSGSTEFTMYSYTPVYPIQYPKYTNNWLNVSNVKNVVKPIGYTVNYDTPLTGLTYSSSTVTLKSGIDADGWHNQPTIIIRGNLFGVGIPEDKIYQQREFGRVQFYDNVLQ